MRTFKRAICHAAGLIAILALIGGCASSPSDSSAAQSQMSTTSGSESLQALNKMFEIGNERLKAIMGHPQSQGVRNMLGGARGFFVAPHVFSAATIFGFANGTGFMIRRHGKDWSDPVFLRLTTVSVGFQAGGKDEHLLVLLMTDDAVEDFTKGNFQLGGTGGFALGKWGIGASAGGSESGGLEMLIISSAEGAFLGAGWTSSKPELLDELNTQVYGSGFDAKEVLGKPGGAYPAAVGVRETLGEMVVQSWDQGG